MNAIDFGPRYLFAICLAIAVGQATLLTLDPHATITSDLLTGVAAFLAAIGCLHAAYCESAETRNLWILLGLAFLLSTVGQVSSTYDEITTTAHTQTTALNSDFLFFSYGIPILLAICSGGKDVGLRVLVWLDGAQALVAAMLAYLQIFSAFSSFAGRTPISATNLMYLYNVENLVLAGAVILRLFSEPRGAKRRFYRILTLYLSAYAVVALVLGYLELERNVPDGIQDTAWAIPYLVLLGALAFRRKGFKSEDAPKNERRSIGLLIDNLSPVLFTLAIVLMGVRIAPEHRWVGVVCIIFAVAIYGIRAALLQGKYVRSQEELTKSAYALLEANDRLMNLSIRDGLTGIYNRRRFDEALQLEWSRANRTEQAFSLLMIDIDCFKALNDLYGHQQGDLCLRNVALAIREMLKRPNDLVARYGGEEFAVILPGTDMEGGFLKAEEIRYSVFRLGIPNASSVVETVVTVSIGVSAGLPDQTVSAEDLVKRADDALYRAKVNGRNQTRTSDESHLLVSFNRPKADVYE
jgi:diguanylate cyclase (GGDEF)-like protein